MTIRIDTGINGVTIERVDILYQEFKRMDVPEYYEQKGTVNPFAGRCDVIPSKATFYSLVPEDDVERLTMARAIMKGLARRRKVKEVICSKHAVNYNQFEKTEQIVVLYV